MDQQIVTALGSASAPINWVLELSKILIPVAAAVWVALRQISISKATLELSRASYQLSNDQKEIAGAKLNLDLFEERYKVFEEVWKTLSDIFIAGPKLKDLPAFSPPFNQILPKLQFLFGVDVEKFVELAIKNWKELGAIDARIKMNHDLVPPDDVVTLRDLQMWFAQAAIQCKDVFGSYMSFEKWH